MKPQFLEISSNKINSFSARKDTKPDVNNNWHYHSVLELIYFKKGAGIQYIGDSIKSFGKGDVILVGKNLPHYWRFGEKYFENMKEKVEVYVIHFAENFWGDDFLKLPENTNIRTKLSVSKRGIQFTGKTKENLSKLIPTIIESTGTTKIIKLLETLNTISESKEFNLLASPNYEYQHNENEKKRMMDIYNFTLKNFTQKTELEVVAKIANLSPTAFCKFFKQKNGKTYTQFVNEIRIGEACKKLIENELTIKEICFSSGFNNFTSFHECFKKITGNSPLKYQQLLKK